jgi:hypothetical protein
MRMRVMSLNTLHTIPIPVQYASHLPAQLEQIGCSLPSESLGSLPNALVSSPSRGRINPGSRILVREDLLARAIRSICNHS